MSTIEFAETRTACSTLALALFRYSQYSLPSVPSGSDHRFFYGFGGALLSNRLLFEAGYVLKRHDVFSDPLTLWRRLGDPGFTTTPESPEQSAFVVIVPNAGNLQPRALTDHL